MVVMEKSRDPKARNLEILGQYNPRSTPKIIELKEDRIQYWLSVGAQPSATVENLLINAGIMKSKKKAKSIRISNKRRARLEEKKAEKENKKAAAELAAEEAVEAPADATPEAEAPAETKLTEESPATEEEAAEPTEEAAPKETPAE
jgi:small subunit ribosomal protein S16